MLIRSSHVLGLVVQDSSFARAVGYLDVMGRDGGGNACGAYSTLKSFRASSLESGMRCGLAASVDDIEVVSM